MNIEMQITNLIRQIGRMKDKAEDENRDLTIAEANRLDDLLDEIEGLEERAKRQKVYKPLTLVDGILGNNFNGNRSKTIMKEGKIFKNIGEQLLAVRAAGIPGGQTDSRLFKVAESRAASGLSESMPSDGGFLVEQGFAQTMLDRAFETGLLAKLCRQMPITVGSSLKVPGIDETSRVAGSRWGGVRGYWADEASEKTASQPKFRQIELNLHKLIGLCYATDELLQDATALGAYIEQAFSEEFGFLMDDAIINGTGAGQPLGILNAGCVVSVAKETGQAADTIVYENVLKMWSRLIASARADSVWLINQDCEPQLYQMSMAIGTGGAPVYLPAGGAAAQPFPTLFGRPVLPIEQCQTVGTTGDIILASFGKGYIFSQKGGMQSDMSIHVRFVYDESVFRFVLRIDGQPLLRSAITPFKGGSAKTLSHFVKLDSRD